jgi:hypothetical protein
MNEIKQEIEREREMREIILIRVRAVRGFLAHNRELGHEVLPACVVKNCK